jgi:uncharacterized membrane protein YfcA
MTTIHILYAMRYALSFSYEFVEGDVHWDARATLLYPFLCTGAGILAGLFGVGGGMIKGPLVLEMGLTPMQAHGINTPTHPLFLYCLTLKKKKIKFKNKHAFIVSLLTIFVCLSLIRSLFILDLLLFVKPTFHIFFYTLKLIFTHTCVNSFFHKKKTKHLECS